MKTYWIAVAMFYLSLGVLSFYFSHKFSTNFNNQYKKLKFTVAGEPFLKHVIDYLNISTWINVGGFALAAFAALVS